MDKLLLGRLSLSVGAVRSQLGRPSYSFLNAASQISLQLRQLITRVAAKILRPGQWAVYFSGAIQYGQSLPGPINPTCGNSIIGREIVSEREIFSDGVFT